MLVGVDSGLGGGRAWFALAWRGLAWCGEIDGWEGISGDVDVDGERMLSGLMFLRNDCSRWPVTSE